MKSFHANILAALFGFLSFAATSQTSEKTLVKSFNLQGLQSVLLELDGTIEVQEWDSDIVRIQMIISLSNGNENMLKAMIRANRYNLNSKIKDTDFIVFAPSLEKEVSVSGVLLEEKISYIINAPKKVSVRIGDTATSLQEVVAGEPSSL